MIKRQFGRVDSRGKRLGVALLVGIGFASVTAWIVRPNGPNRGLSDFLTYWLAAKGLLAGTDVYRYVATERPPGMFAPLPIAFLAVPFAWLPSYLAAPIFFGIGCAALAFVITRAGWHPLLLFAAAPIWHGAVTAQVAPLLLAASMTPIAWGLLGAKPNVALPLLAGQPTLSSRTLTIGAMSCAVVLALSLALAPRWPMAWLDSLRRNPESGQYRIPMLTMWGAVLWLPLLRWRSPSARLVFVMALVPQNFFFYEQLPLLLVPTTRRELMIVALTSQIASTLANMAHRGDLTFLQWNAVSMPYVMLGLYVPVIVMVLRRPNGSPRQMHARELHNEPDDDRDDGDRANDLLDRRIDRQESHDVHDGAQDDEHDQERQQHGHTVSPLE